MSDVKRMLSAANTILKTIQDGADAYNNFKKGQDDKAWAKVISGTSRIIKGWDNIEYLYGEIEKYTGNIFGSSTNRANQISKGQINHLELGKYSGIWFNDEFLFTLDQDRETNLSVLSRLNNGGLAYYKGYYNPDSDRFLWVGQNSNFQKLVIVGIPHGLDYIFADLWMPNESEDLIYTNTITFIKSIAK